MNGRHHNLRRAEARLPKQPSYFCGAAAAGVAAFSDFAACPLKVRVGANSPSLWPTMFSVT